MRILSWQVGAVLLAIGATASAQTTIYGQDNRLGNFFMSDSGSFVASYSVIGPQPTFFPCLDFDASATTVHVAQYYTTNHGTIDMATGLYTNVGTITGGVGSASGWSADADGSTWWYSTYDSAAAATNLYTVDLGTGIATPVGVISPTIQIDIAISATGALYGHSINDDALYSIDTTTGVGTYIGSTGYIANYAQGMDFDWSTGQLLATIYTGGGTGTFVDFDLTTGFGNPLDVTTPLNAEMEMGCMAVGAGEPGEALGFGDVNCPCGNNNDGTLPLGGCAHDEAYNGNGAAGARLDASGMASVSNDSVVLHGSRGQVSNSTLFFQGNNDLTGMGIFLGDGHRIAGGGVIRIQPRPTNSNGDASTTIGISAKTGVGAGETKYYQWWIRDPAGSTCGAESNTSNGYKITWTP